MICKNYKLSYNRVCDLSHTAINHAAYKYYIVMTTIAVLHSPEHPHHSMHPNIVYTHPSS